MSLAYQFTAVTGQGMCAADPKPAPWPKPREQNLMACTCREDGAPVKRRCNSNWTRCNARLAAVRDWQAEQTAGGAR